MTDLFMALSDAMGLSLESQDLDIGHMAVRAVVTYMLLVGIARLGHQRMLDHTSAFDIILGILLGSIASRAITGNAPFFPSIGACAVLVALHALFAAIAFRWHFFGFLVKGRSKVLVREGTPDRRQMRWSHVAEHDLEEALRLEGTAKADKRGRGSPRAQRPRQRHKKGEGAARSRSESRRGRAERQDRARIAHHSVAVAARCWCRLPRSTAIRMAPRQDHSKERQMNHSRLGAALIAAGVSLAFAGSAVAQIKIGVNEPLTGAVAASGNYVTNGAKIAADEINAKGGIKGQKIELVIEDNKSNPTEAVAAAEKLIVRDKVPVMMGAWSSTYTLAVMPKLMEYKVPMLVETSSSDKITVQGNPYVFRISPTSGMEADAFATRVAPMKIKKADFLVVNNDWGKGTADVFQKMLKEKGAQVGAVETMDASAQDMNAQLSKIRSSDADTLFITTAVEQLTLVLKQVQALGLKRQIITTGGSQSPDQLIEQAGAAANGTYHLLFFPPWFPEASANPALAKSFVAEWKKRNLNFAGLTEGFRGYDGIYTIAAAIEKAGKADPEAIRQALWTTQLTGVNGKIAFKKAGPAGKESGQSVPTVYMIKIDSGKVSLVK